MRRRPWIGRELPMEAKGWARLADNGAASPAARAEATGLIDAIRDAIAGELTPRGALYKTLHDGRCKLRARLAGDGFSPDQAGR
jgi:RNA polymerase sigma-70 factor, ECF subfamily